MKLPDQKDFYKSELDPDGKTAWNNFGGLTIAEAYEKFCERPYTYQEDFMFMGYAAFVFYFPIIDKYIREVEFLIAFSNDTYILSKGIEIRLEKKVRLPDHINNRIIDLYKFILDSCELPSVQKKSADLIEEDGGLQSFHHTLAKIKILCTSILEKVQELAK